MTFLVAFARPDVALVAGDTRGYTLEGWAFARPRDGVRKIHALSDGWLGGGFHAGWTDRIARALVDCSLKDAGGVCARVAALQPEVGTWLAGLPPSIADTARSAARVFTIAIERTGFTCREIDWITGREVVMTTGEVGACLPAGMAEDELLPPLREYHAALDGADVDAALRLTGGLFATVAERLGAGGSVSPDLEVGVLWRSRGQVVRRDYLPPTSASRVATGRHRLVPVGDPLTRPVADVFALQTKTVKVGTVASPSSITKTLRIPCAELLPQDDTQIWNIPGGADIRPRAVNTPANFMGAIVLPGGATVTVVRYRSFRQMSSDAATCSFIRVQFDTTTVIASMAHATTGWATVSASVTEATIGRTYVIQVALTGVAAAADARFGWFELDYTVTDYKTGI